MPATRRWQRLGALPLLLILALAGSLLLAGPAQARTDRYEKILRAIQVAVAQQGDPYVYGAAGPDAFDCSGLTMYAFNNAGFSLPHSSSAQYDQLRHIPQSNAIRGDLVFFYDSSGIYHVGLLAGRVNGVPLIWHASRPGTDVKRDRIWTSSWVAGTFRR